MLAFVPDSIEENCRLKNLFDDDVDVSASVKSAVTLPVGETLIWDHIYKRGGPGYRICSGDRADIDLLRVYGNGIGAHVKTRLTLFFAHGDFRSYEWSNYWTEPDLTVISANDVLGVLKDKTIAWFRVAVSLLDGVQTIDVERMDFFWEASDIEYGDYMLNNIIDIEGIGPVYAEKLEIFGIHTVEQLLHAGITSQQRADLAMLTGISEKRILRWVNMADLFRLNGVGEEFSDLLEVSGIESIRDLASCQPDTLHALLTETNGERNLVRRLPSEKDLKQWIIQARNMEQLVMH